MNTQLFITFIILNILNVIIQTVKSLVTVKCGKVIASLTNAVAYGLYTIVVVYMVCDLPLSLKVLVVALCNLIGVYLVKLAEEKSRKDKLWKVELTVRSNQAEKLHKDLDNFDIPHSFIQDIGKYTIFFIYCATQKESAFVKEIADKNTAKYFVSESKDL